MTPSLARSFHAALIAATLAVLASGSSAFGQDLSNPPDSVDLLLDATSQIDGAAESDLSGFVMAVADVNGDRRTDVVLSTNRRQVRVVFGGLGPLIDLSSFTNGFTISGGTLSRPLANAGDVNGDGLDDLLLTDDIGNRAIVVFGRTETTPVDVDDLGTGGYSITMLPDFFPASVAGAGDVNGDGLDDLLIPNGATAYVIFGQTATTPISVDALGGGGYPIETEPGVTGSTLRVAGAGDVDADGRADVLIGAQFADGAAGDASGRAWVVLGKANATPVDVDQLGSAGYLIEGAEEGDGLGSAVANAGDANGDGVPDQVIGAVTAGDAFSGKAYVVFGHRTSRATVDTGALGSRGYEIDGVGFQERVGDAVSGGVDLNGDGRDDQVIGARASSEGGRDSAGAAYVVYGRRGTATVDLASYRRGYRIDGPAANARAGSAVALPPRRVGEPRVVVNAPFATANGRELAGSTYALGGITFTPAPIDRVSILTAPARRLAGAGGGRRYVLRYRVKRRVAVDATLLRIVEGRRQGAGAGRCRTGGGQPAGRRQCVVHRRFDALQRTHRAAGTVSVPLPRALPPSRYVVRLVAKLPNGRRVGPFLTVLTVPRG